MNKTIKLSKFESNDSNELLLFSLLKKVFLMDTLCDGG
ncbi:Hypothetical protein ADU69_1645 [Pediococcus damnosus]|nr:Hypothetical protein ADU69_1645 [Pediococcus damnosus]